MLAKLRPHRPGHATVVAYLALFVAFGGSSYAAVRVTSQDVPKDALTGADIKKLTGKEPKNLLIVADRVHELSYGNRVRQDRAAARRINRLVRTIEHPRGAGTPDSTAVAPVSTPNSQRPTPNAQLPTPNALVNITALMRRCGLSQPKRPSDHSAALGVGNWELGVGS